MLTVFAFIGQLFEDKAERKGFFVYEDEERGIHSKKFLKWCQKLEGLKEAQYARGMTTLESRAKEAGRLGKDYWPPGYAEFIGMATECYETRCHKEFEYLALPDQAKIDHDRAPGRATLDKLKGMFS